MQIPIIEIILFKLQIPVELRQLVARFSCFCKQKNYKISVEFQDDITNKLRYLTNGFGDYYVYFEADRHQTGEIKLVDTGYIICFAFFDYCPYHYKMSVTKVAAAKDDFYRHQTYNAKYLLVPVLHNLFSQNNIKTIKEY